MQFARIVEGHGETQAVRMLLERLVLEMAPGAYIEIRPIMRASRSKLVKTNVIEDYVERAARTIIPPGAIFVLLDSDYDW